MAGCFPRHLCCRPAAVNAARCCHNVPHQTRAEHQNKNTHRRPYQQYDPPHIDSDHRYTQQQGSATRHPASARHPQAPRCRHQCPNNAYTHTSQLAAAALQRHAPQPHSCSAAAPTAACCAAPFKRCVTHAPPHFFLPHAGARGAGSSSSLSPGSPCSHMPSCALRASSWKSISLEMTALADGSRT